MAKKRTEPKFKDIKRRKLPTLKRRKIKRKPGKKFDMGLLAFISYLFKHNEILPRREKMTDATIADIIYREFNNRDESDIDKFKLSNPELHSLMNKYRSDYNRGRITGSDGPPQRKYVSFFYDEDGDACNPKFQLPKKLTEKEKEERRDRYRKFRLKWERERNLKPGTLGDTIHMTDLDEMVDPNEDDGHDNGVGYKG